MINLLNNAKYYYNTNIKYYNILEFINLINSLSNIYIFIYKYISLKQKILISNNSKYCLFYLKYITYLTNMYYIQNRINLDLYTNINMLQRNLILYKWLEYFLYYNLILKKNFKYKCLLHGFYILYLKLKLKYNGIKQLNNIPNLLLFIESNNNNKINKKIMSLNRNIILITNKIQKNIINKNNIYILNLKYINLPLIYFIIKIIFTAIFHSLILNNF